MLLAYMPEKVYNKEKQWKAARFLSIEFEIKLRADQTSFARMLQHFSGQGQRIEMQTTYYDTPTDALSRRHYTLRRRLENGVSVCTLKTPAAANERNETELVCDDMEKAIPRLQALGAPSDFSQLTKEGLIPVCGAKFTRYAVPLEMPDCTAELALDQGILFGADREQPFYEVEVELKQGDREQVCRFASYLLQTYSLTLEEHSKFRRALALYKGEEL